LIKTLFFFYTCSLQKNKLYFRTKEEAMKKDNDLITGAVTQLNENFNIKAKYLSKKDVLQIVFAKHTLELTPIIEKNITATVIADYPLLAPKDRILVTQYATPNTAEMFKSKNIQFMDLAGNIYINRPPLLIYVQGKKPTFDIKPTKPIRLFKTAGVKVIFTLLSKPGIESETYRTIAREANVSLNAVARVLQDLKTTLFLIEKGKWGRQIMRKEELFRKWIDAYQQQLQPKLLINSYYCDDIRKMQKEPIAQFEALWGSEPAAAITTKYLHPGILTLYTDKINPHILLRNRLKKKQHGNVVFMKKFWNFEDEWTKQGLVPPLLTYADMIITHEDRNIETAEILYEQAIAQLIY